MARDTAAEDARRQVILDLVDHEYAAVFGYLYRLTGDRETAEALVRQTFMSALADRRRVANAPGPRAWVFRVATERARQAHPENQPSAAWAPPRLADSESASAAGAAALAGLSFDDRAALLLRWHDGLSLAELAVVFRSTPGAARERVAAALAALIDGQGVPAPHAEYAGRLADYADLSPDEAAQVDAHLADCPDCAAWLAAGQAAGRDLAGLVDAWPSSASREQLRSEIAKGAGAEAPEQRTRKPLSRGVWAGAVALALVIALIGGLWLLTTNAAASRPSPALPPPATIEAGTAEPAPVAVATPVFNIDTPAPDASIAWLREHVVTFEGVEPGSDPVDLKSLDQMVGNARLVVFNDATDYGSHEFMATKERILEYLVEQKSFNNVIFEMPWSVGETFNRFGRGGFGGGFGGGTAGGGSNNGSVYQGGAGFRGDPTRLLQMLTGPQWQTTEMLYTFRWLQTHNSGAGFASRVAIHGYLPSAQSDRASAMNVLRFYLNRVDSQAADMLGGDLNDLMTYMTDHRDEMIAKSTQSQFALAAHALLSMVQADQLAAAGNSDAATQLYGQFTRDNLTTTFQEALSTTKFILFTQDVDGAAGLPAGNLMPALKTAFGEDMVVFDFHFGQGTVNAASSAAPSSNAAPALHQIPDAPGGTVEDYLHRAGLPRFFLDLSQVIPGTPAASWIAGEHPVRLANADYSTCDPGGQFAPAQLMASGGKRVLVYFDQVSPSTLPQQGTPVVPAVCAAAPAITPGGPTPGPTETATP